MTTRERRRRASRRYQNGLRAIKRRTGATHREAQAVYRAQREIEGRPVPAVRFDRQLASSTLKRKVRDARRRTRPIEETVARVVEVPRGRTTAFPGVDAAGRGEIAFDLRDLVEGGLVENPFPPGEIARELRFTVTYLINGVPAATVEGGGTLDDPLGGADLWPSYFDMLRDELDDFITSLDSREIDYDNVGIAVASVTIR